MGGMKSCSNGPDHVTKMATMSIYGKNPLKISETFRLLIFKLGIKHQGLWPFKICSNDDIRLTLAYFTARSTLLPIVLVWANA